MNVLIVDDDLTSAAILRRAVVRELSASVHQASNGAEALMLLEQHRMALIITDLRMPVMNGLELLEAVRHYAPLTSIPVVVMSVERDEGMVRRAIELGIADYLIKPLDSAQLNTRLQLVKRLIDRATDTEEPLARKERAVSRANGPAYLIADGSADFRRLARAALASESIVIEAATGLEAFTKSAETTPSVLLVGDGLGILNAEILVRKIRSMPACAETRIIAIIPNHQPGDGPPLLHLHGVIARTSTAETFREELDRVLRVSEVSDRE